VRQPDSAIFALIRPNALPHDDFGPSLRFLWKIGHYGDAAMRDLWQQSSAATDVDFALE
jgi:hypothetical protein